MLLRMMLFGSVGMGVVFISGLGFPLSRNLGLGGSIMLGILVRSRIILVVRTISYNFT